MPTPSGRFFGLCVASIVLFFSLLLAGSASAAIKNPVTAFPSPGTPAASDGTTFSFRGVKPRLMGPITVIGSRSGRHTGRRVAHSDGRGVSFVPRRKFVRGELVRVFTRKKIWKARNGDFQVRIGRFYGNDDKMGKPGAPNEFPRLMSRPDLRPPKIKVISRTGQAAPGRMFIDPKQTGLTILDRYGRINWFQMTGYGGNGEQVQDFKPQRYEGRQVLTYWKGASTSRGFSQIGYYTILNRRYNVIEQFRMANGYKPDAHDMILTPRGTALMLAYRGVLWDASRFGGSKNEKVMDNIVQEVDIKTGAVVFEWHSLGNVNLEATISKPNADGAPWDYFHVNSVEDDGDSLLVSARKTSSIYRIDRRTGWVRWRLRGDGLKPKTNDFVMGEGTHFGYQHDARRLPNGDISLFDNGSAAGLSTVRRQSSALILRLRIVDGKRRAGFVRRYDHTTNPIASASQGSAEIMPNGNAFIGWGSTARMTEMTPGGEVAFDASFHTAPSNSYRARKALWMGIPKFRPAIASRASESGATVWASWNGATRIARWRVLTGPSAKQMKAVVTRPWGNLETAIPVPYLGRFVQVEAVDYDDKVIGRSKVTPAGRQSR